MPVYGHTVEAILDHSDIDGDGLLFSTARFSEALLRHVERDLAAQGKERGLVVDEVAGAEGKTPGGFARPKPKRRG